MRYFPYIQLKRTHEFGEGILDFAKVFSAFLDEFPVVEFINGKLAVFDRHIIGNQNELTLVAVSTWVEL